jgi:uncharacterized protein YbjT (DUF2867 family)
MQNIVLAGSTGLIGQSVIKQLDHFDCSATLLTRRPLNLISAQHKTIVTDFSDIDLPQAESDRDAFLCALGTTIKTAGSKEAFAAIDFDLVKRLAQAAKQKGYEHFIVISSLGTTPSTNNFYLQTKAKMESALESCGFKSLAILRPSLLLGERQEFRLGEKVAEKASSLLMPLFKGKFSRYQPIHADSVARAMLALTLKPSEGVRIVESDEIRRLATESERKSH